MSGEEDEQVAGKESSKNGAPDGVTALPPDDPRVTPLGGNAGVHIRSDENPEDRQEASIDFGGFIVSLGTSCMINLGKHTNPETGQIGVDLPAARQVIEILEMLRHKTRNNLDPEEEKLLDTLLHDLKQAYQDAGA